MLLSCGGGWISGIQEQVLKVKMREIFSAATILIIEANSLSITRRYLIVNDYNSDFRAAFVLGGSSLITLIGYLRGTRGVNDMIFNLT